jgi:uncharacterized OsmC-like protein
MFTNDMILYGEKPERYTHIHIRCEVAGYKISSNFVHKIMKKKSREQSNSQ